MEYPIVSKISAEESSARITNLNAVIKGKLNCENVLIQPFSENRAYAHHAAITVYKNRIYAMWSSGRVNEDDCGQRVLWSYSNGFNDWSEPEIFADTAMGEHSELVRFAQGFFATEDRLFGYFFEIEYRKEDMQGENFRPKTNTPPLSIKRYCRILNEDGISWGEPIAIEGGSSNHSAERLSSGRYMIATAIGAKYTDDISGMPKWTLAEVDWKYIEAAKEKGAVELCETSFFETDDGIIHYMMRSGDFKLWHAESYDNGETLTAVYPTNYTDGLSKFQFGRLPDGRYYYVGNPLPKPDRTVLALEISENGYDFNERYIIRDEPNQVKQKGMFKGGMYGYPECVIYDGYMYVIYSMQKEEIAITRFSLDQIK